MEATRKITNISKGQTVETIITRTIESQDKVVYADGWNVNTGIETINTIKITIKINGKTVDHSDAPEICNPKYYAKVIAQGAYARLGNGYITKERYNQIMAAIAEIDAELGNVKVSAESVEIEPVIDSEICPLCGGYCDGDCQAN